MLLPNPPLVMTKGRTQISRTKSILELFKKGSSAFAFCKKKGHKRICLSPNQVQHYSVEFSNSNIEASTLVIQRHDRRFQVRQKHEPPMLSPKNWKRHFARINSAKKIGSSTELDKINFEKSERKITLKVYFSLERERERYN
ncbi:hypothetical protein VNO77_16842 [Canavalia gladiata]|uniref:Uncharacterized protein n=1 Tax=Canavalia gladiata TaxID=3824 RepID=A0AAN9QIT7_CANGL